MITIFLYRFIFISEIIDLSDDTEKGKDDLDISTRSLTKLNLLTHWDL